MLEGREFEEARAALSAIGEGGVPKDFETETLDFKEDPARSSHPTRNPEARIIEVLLDASICFANSERGGVIVVGVADRSAGISALRGTELDESWVQAKIFNGTVPQLRVEVRDFEWAGVRLLAIHVPRGLTVYSRTNGAASQRVGTDCQPLHENQRRVLAFQRANPDFTSQPSTLEPHQLSAEALDYARGLLRSTGRQASADTRQLLRDLKLVTDEDSMTVAAEVLFAPAQFPRVRHLARRSPLGEPASTEFSGPMLLTFRAVGERLRAHSSPEIDRVSLPSGQELAIPDYPPIAVDEALANAFVHRDWALTGPIVVDQSPQILRITSPGPLPVGVTVHNLLVTPSRPRNQQLMTAMHILGLVEENSRGIDRMTRTMLRTGRPVPEFKDDDYAFQVTFLSGPPDAGLITGLAHFAASNPEIADDTAAVLVLATLYSHAMLNRAGAAALLQVEESVAIRQMQWLEGLGLIQRRSTPRVEWELTDLARTFFGAPKSSETDVQAAVRAELIRGPITNTRLQSALGLSSVEARRALESLRKQGVIMKDPEGPARGTGVRWIKQS